MILDHPDEEIDKVKIEKLTENLDTNSITQDTLHNISASTMT